MKKILLVFTGGTIGSVATDGCIKPSKDSPYQLLQMLQNQYEHYHELDFTIIQPLQILSENLAPEAWNTLITSIEDSQPNSFDGIIVTHGTDTLAYSAALLSLYFNKISVPLLLVSSDYPLADARANGLQNLICALEFIRQKIAVGVFVPYRNHQNQITHVHQGSRIACSLQLTGDFYSVQNKIVSQFKDNVFQPLNPQIPSNHDKQYALKPVFKKQILMIKPYPGLNYQHFNLSGVSAVLHDLYHSGTACANEQWGSQYSLVPFIKHCTEQGIPVYLAPIIKSENAYQSTQTLVDAGAKLIWNMSIEAAYAKLHLAYNCFENQKDIGNFLDAYVAGEHI